MVEVYAQALLRDIPFSDYVGDPEITVVANELAGLTDFLGPKTPATLFRGVFEGDQVGPYLSQFLYKDIPAGPKVVDQRYTGYTSGQNFMTSYDEWLKIENGQNPTASVVPTLSPRYMITGRDLARYVHQDFTYQAYHNAALILLSWGPSAWDNGNPYKTAARQGAFIDLGAGEILDTVARAGNAALRAAWFQKWNVHRRLRPEEYGGLAQNNPGLLHGQFTSSPVLAKVRDHVWQLLVADGLSGRCANASRLSGRPCNDLRRLCYRVESLLQGRCHHPVTGGTERQWRVSGSYRRSIDYRRRAQQAGVKYYLGS